MVERCNAKDELLDNEISDEDGEFDALMNETENDNRRGTSRTKKTNTKAKASSRRSKKKRRE